MISHIIQLFAQLRKHGAHCVMETNSLASTDVSANKRGVSAALPGNAWISGLGAIEGPF